MPVVLIPTHTSMGSVPPFSKYAYRERSGYIITDSLLAIGHTAMVPPWSDPAVHLHQDSEEYYLLLHGALEFLVADSRITLMSEELLAIQSAVPHAIIGGVGPIEHLGFRAPVLEDKHVVSEILSAFPFLGQEERELRCDWGYRIPLKSAENQNCWLLGNGTARFKSRHMSLANLNFPTDEAANAGIGTRHRLHLHQQSWEYYLTLRGAKTLRIEDDLVSAQAGEIVVVPPNVWHTLFGRWAPYEGFTIRVPCLDWNDKVEHS